MTRLIVTSPNAPAAIGPYSQAIDIGNLIFTSGQIPLDPNTGDVVSIDVKEQTHQVLKNLTAVLEQAGSDLSQVVKSTVFIKDMNQFADVNAVYGEYFSQNPPARSCVEVARLPKDVLVEIEVVALKK